MRSGSPTEVPPNFWTIKPTPPKATEVEGPRRSGSLRAVATEKRQRQKENRKRKMEEVQREVKKSRIQRRVITIGVVAVVLLGSLFLWSVLSGDDDDEVATTVTTSTTVADGTEGSEGEGSEGTEGTDPIEAVAPQCPAEDGESVRTLQFTEAPPDCLAEGATYEAVLSTNHGDITLALDREAAPNTVNNFVFLARHGYYNGVSFHRVIEGFMIQGGDAVGTPLGTGGPGYRFDDELPENSGAYVQGALAMANSGPNTNGSQFFIVTGTMVTSTLDPDYTVFGSVSDGLDVALAISQVETGGRQGTEPVTPVIIESVTINQHS